MFRHNWRGLDDWRAEGLPLRSTSSNAASKLFDAAVTQYIGWFDDPNFGGLPETINNMIKEDPNFVMGRAFSIGLELIGTTKTIRLDKQLETDLQDLNNLAQSKKDEIGWREWQHVNALVMFADGRLNEATSVWEQILVECPTDLVALKFAHDTYFYLGKQLQLRDSVARVMPVWTNKRLPLQSYLHGMYSFGLEETNLFAKAEKEAKIGLEKNRNDGWATHTLAHIREMEGRTEDGIEVMRSTVDNWQACNYLACHNYWHWALYHIEREEYESALEIFETRILKRALTGGSMLDAVDASSLLYRLDLFESKKLSLADHWEEVYAIIKPHLRDHILGFNDSHFLMACLGAKHYKEAEDIIETLTPELNSDALPGVTRLLMQALMAFSEEKYDKAVDCLYEIRYDIVNIGGSNAQRDIFNQILIMAALKSPLSRHKRLCQTLLNERYAQKSTPLVQRLLSEAI